MKAVLNGEIVAESNDTVAVKGYDYFLIADARTDLPEKTPRTPKDLECPHGVQFYDVVIGAERHERNAWIYERPQPAISAVADRVGFWKDVKVG